VLISTLDCGGAERVAALLANGLSARGHDVALVTLAGPREPFFPVAHGVRPTALGVSGRSRGLRQALAANSRRLEAIVRHVERTAPDVLISFMTETNVLCLLATRLLWRLPCRVVISERINPAVHHPAPIWRLGRRLTYPLADALVACSRGVRGWFEGWLARDKLWAIPNPVTVGERSEDRAASEVAAGMASEHWILGMGSLAPRKGFDMLLEAFAGVPQRVRAGWKVGLIGEGPLRGELARQIAALGLDGVALLLGRYGDPMPLLERADIFVLSSRYEGFPNALTEAMACGAAAVAFDCPSGPAEIIRDGVDGILVPPGDVGALSATLAGLMLDVRLRGRVGARAPEVRERFSESRFLDEWEKLIDALRLPSEAT